MMLLAGERKKQSELPVCDVLKVTSDNLLIELCCEVQPFVGDVT